MLALAGVCSTLGAHTHAAEPVRLGIRVIHAHNHGNSVDPKVKALVADLKQLKFSAFELKDEATLTLELGSTGRMQLPSGTWMTLTPRALGDDGKLRLELEVKKLKFKTTVAIAHGGTIAVGGPPYQDGALILAVTRPADDS